MIYRSGRGSRGRNRTRIGFEVPRRIDARSRGHVVQDLCAPCVHIEKRMIRLFANGEWLPISRRGVADCPGLHIVVSPWLHNAKSSLLFGVTEVAASTASTINGIRVDSSPRSRQNPIVPVGPCAVGSPRNQSELVRSRCTKAAAIEFDSENAIAWF